MINIQNIDDDEFFKWSIVRYLNLTDHNPRRITKAEKDIAKKLDFKDIKFPLKVRDIHKIEKKNSIGISVFGYENKEKHVDLLLREEEGKKTMFLSKILILSYMILLYIVAENISVVIVCKLLLQKKY